MSKRDNYRALEGVPVEPTLLPRKRVSVYFASKIHHAPIGRALAAEWTEFWWTSRWPTHHVGKMPSIRAFAKEFWLHDEEDVRASDVVLVYAEPGDKLRGALVEAGIAIGHGVRVVVVGENECYGTWQHHPLVTAVADLAEARQLLRAMGV